jgi:hypothetical protein
MNGADHEESQTAGDSQVARDSGEETGLLAQRWRRYGKDRLYVNRAHDVEVGWWDLTTDEPHPATPDDLAELHAAVEAWRDAGSRRAVLVPPATRSSGDATQALEGPTAAQEAGRPWIDLATNPAGAAAREQAVAAKGAAPVRTVVARALGVHTDERAWRIGADGEEKVATQLARAVKKDPRWRVIHAIPVGTRGSDIDHLILGPGGVFTANAKHHPRAKIWVGGNTFLINGAKHPYVRNSRYEAARAAELLSEACGFSVPVEGVIVTVNAADVVVKNQPDGVSVVPRMQVAKWLLRHGEILAQPTIDSIYEVARRSTTWRP